MKTTFLFLLMAIGIQLIAQDKEPIYNPNANAKEELNKAIEQAKLENKHVLIQIGGNWCPWCHKLHNFFKSEQEIDSVLNKYYIVQKINYSKENKNLDILKELEFPQRFGFPVLVVLDANGKRLHTQDSALLEEKEGYSKKKVMGFLLAWSPDALKPENYNK